MTFEQLLGLDAKSLEDLSDEEKIKILQPCLEICPPIDLKILQQEKLELDLKKLQEKEKKKEEKKLAKLANTPSALNVGDVTTVVKKKSSLKAKNLLDSLQAMKAMIDEKMKDSK